VKDIYFKMKRDIARGFPANFKMAEEGIERPLKTRVPKWMQPDARQPRFGFPGSKIRTMLKDMPKELLDFATA